MTSEPGSFARATIVERKPQIIRQVIADNGYRPQTVGTLEAFRREIAQGRLQPLTETAPDVAFWNEQALAYRDRAWLDLPWYFAETYFYRRLLEAVGYFQPGPWQGCDPFGVQKRAQDRAAMALLAATGGGLDGQSPEGRFALLLHSSLWGNRADLSNFTVREEVRSGDGPAEERHNVLIDHTEQVTAYLSSGVDRVDFVNDNAGRELLFDLILADFLLTEGWAQTVVFHLKGQPFFVSDAMIVDVQEIVALLDGEDLGQRLRAHVDDGRLVLQSDPFWTTNLMFRETPAPLTTELAQADLIIFKGDVNYRRLLDDAHWPHTARLEDIATYIPASFVALRTLKAEIMVGLGPGQAASIAAGDPEWLINGRRGLVHFVGKGQVTRKLGTSRQ
jgi:hypothetical protein